MSGFAVNGVKVTWPAQPLNLNSIEHLGGDVKKYVAEKQPLNAEELWITGRHSWHQITLKRWQDLIDLMPRRCAKLIKKQRLFNQILK